MLSREEIEQMIDQKIEPLTEEIAALKAQLSKVDLLTIDNRNIRQSLGRIETNQESLKLDFERQEKRSVHFEKQTNSQFMDIKTTLKEQSSKFVELDGKVVGLQTEMRQRLSEQDNTIAGVQTTITGVQTTITGVQTTITGMQTTITGMQTTITGMQTTITGMQTTIAGVQTTQAEHTALLQQILARLPE